MTITIGRSFWWVATPPMQQVTPTRGIRAAHGGGYGCLWVESLGDFHKSVVLQEKQDFKNSQGLSRDWSPKFETWLNIIIGIVQKV